MAFHTLLNTIIDAQTITKNSIIHETGIDRSSFYQILNGKRLPTKEQLSAMIRLLNLSVQDEMSLYDMFYLERLGETNFSYLKFTERCLQSIADTDNDASRITCPEALQNFLNGSSEHHLPEAGTTVYHSTEELANSLCELLWQASKCPHTILRVSLPFELSAKLSLMQSIRYLSANGGFQNARMDQLLHFETTDTDGVTNKLRGFAGFLRFIMSKQANVIHHIHYDPDETRITKNSGILLPYYILTEKACLMLNTEASGGCRITDPTLLAFMNDEFDIAFEQARPFLSAFSQGNNYIFQETPEDGSRIVYIQNHPGVCLMANDALVQKYVPEPFVRPLSLHFKSMQSTNVNEGVTLAGIMDFAKHRTIDESGFHVELDLPDVIAALYGMLDRLGDNLFVLNTEKLPVSETWSFLLYLDHYILLVPNKELDFILCISDPDIVNAFTYTFSCIDFEDYVLDDDEVRKRILHLIHDIRAK